MSLQMYWMGCKHERIVKSDTVHANYDFWLSCYECMGTPKTDEQLLALHKQRQEGRNSLNRGLRRERSGY